MLCSDLSFEQSQVRVKDRFGHEPVVGHVIDTASDALANFAILIDPIRSMAKQLGYAITVHGSLRRDIDLVAVPWVEEAVEADILVKALVHLVKAFTGEAWGHVDADCPSEKPHGRQAWSIHFWGAYIDLSVMPRIVKEGVDGEVSA